MPQKGLKQKLVVYLVLLVVFISVSFLCLFLLAVFVRQTKIILVFGLSAAFLVCVLGIFISFFIAGKLLKPIKELEQSAAVSKKELEETRAVLEVKVQARTEELQELADKLEDKVEERTKQLSRRVEELERFHRLTVGRELKMIELKKELNVLKNHGLYSEKSLADIEKEKTGGRKKKLISSLKVKVG